MDGGLSEALGQVLAESSLPGVPEMMREALKW